MRTTSTGGNGVHGQPTIKVLDNYWNDNENETGMEVQATVRTQELHQTLKEHVHGCIYVRSSSHWCLSSDWQE